MLTFGVVVLGVTDRARAEEFWCAALGYRVRGGVLGGWARVLEPPGGPGIMIALQLSETPPDDHPFPHDPDFIVLADTEGNRFCIVNLGHEHHASGQDS